MVKRHGLLFNGGERAESSQEWRAVAGTLGSGNFRQLSRETIRLRGFHAASDRARLSRIRGKAATLFFDHESPASTNIFERILTGLR